MVRIGATKLVLAAAVAADRAALSSRGVAHHVALAGVVHVWGGALAVLRLVPRLVHAPHFRATAGTTCDHTLRHRRNLRSEPTATAAAAAAGVVVVVLTEQDNGVGLRRRLLSVGGHVQPLLLLLLLHLLLLYLLLLLLLGNLNQLRHGRRRRNRRPAVL